MIENGKQFAFLGVCTLAAYAVLRCVDMYQPLPTFLFGLVSNLVLVYLHKPYNWIRDGEKSYGKIALVVLVLFLSVIGGLLMVEGISKYKVPTFVFAASLIVIQTQCGRFFKWLRA